MPARHWLSAACLAALGFGALAAHRWLTARPYDQGQFWPRQPGVADHPPQPGAAQQAPPVPPASATLNPIDPHDPTLPESSSALDLPAPLSGTDNYVLVGLDQRSYSRFGGLADTIIVAILDRGHNRLGLVSIPRDLYVEFPGHGHHRINAAMVLAGRDKAPPFSLLNRAIEELLGLPVQHGVAIDLGVFERAVDGVGGVHVHVPCAILDSFLDSRVASGRRELDVPTGRQRLDGITAAMYVRSRHGRSDWSRARRQQAVLLGLRDRVATLSGFRKLPRLWIDLERSITTDLRRIDLLRLARRVTQVPTENLHGMVLGHRYTDAWRSPEGWSVLLPDLTAIRGAVSKVFSAATPGALPGRARCPAPDVALHHRGGKPRRSSAGAGSHGRNPPHGPRKTGPEQDPTLAADVTGSALPGAQQGPEARGLDSTHPRTTSQPEPTLDEASKPSQVRARTL